MPEQEADEVAEVLRSYGLEDQNVTSVVNSIRADKKRWVDFMMRFELGLEEPDPKRASRSAFTIAALLYRRRFGAVGSLFLFPFGTPCSDRVGDRDAAGAADLRLY